ncbi:FAD-binding oxidoreductase [Leucobacter sp. CSA1]|uniref:FAD-binding oxidoreductase n=1 Tax=Leucobacter chromiisoli TaxID=2796471 RepID=A0A934Q587_9MICO|nr:FAD-dependent oxidoreductase [Leucobacter chromiisoli]MBK0418650.1 FAD-binding oxidoreductase [Leucobacter chromiisoli]
MTVRADAVIVGAGVAGLSLAAALAHRRDVVVLEAEARIAVHSSGRSARQMQPSYGPDHIRALTRRSIEIIGGMESGHGTEILTPRSLGWVARPSGVGPLELMLEHLPALRRVEGAELAAELPLADPDVYRAGAIDEDAYEVDVDRLLDAYLADATAGGAEVVTSAAVEHLERRGGRWEIRTARGRYSAPVVVNAAGAWADRVAGLAGVEPRGIRSYRRTVALTSSGLDAGLAHAPMISDVEMDFYARPAGGALLLSPSDEEPVQPGDARPEPATVRRVLERARNRLAVPVPDVERAWAGLRCFSDREVPVTGWDPAAPGFVWLAGQGGYGLQTSAALAEATAQTIAATAERSSPEREA